MPDSLQQITIALDAMGGDNAPDAPVFGAVAALTGGDTHEALRNTRQLPRADVRLLLVGDRVRLESLLQARPLSADVSRRIEVVHASQVIGMDESPHSALDKKKDSSMLVAARLVKEKKAHALVSAGNTGALMAGSLLTLGRLPGIRRPAIAVLWPTQKRHILVLDSGANAESKPEYLLQFAYMGSIYMERVMGRTRPRVGLLNIGGEAGKGGSLYNAAYQLLEKAENINFTGNIEPNEMLREKVDVVVTDGFVGNMILKTGEAVAEMISLTLKEGIMSSVTSKLGGMLLKPVFEKLKKKVDQKEYGGAHLLGLQGIVVKSHGRADEVAILNAINVAAWSVQTQVLEHIAQSIAANKPRATADEQGGASSERASHL
jgi:glycerol-3-phosphate acyltransferase PlsX